MYQNREIAEKAFNLWVRLADLVDEAQEFLKVVEESHAPMATKSWLRRVHENILRFVRPAMDNLDQVRLTLDEERQGLPKGPRGKGPRTTRQPR